MVTTVHSLDSLLSPDRSDREMASLIVDLEDESAEAAQTRARAQEFLSTIMAKAPGKPAAVAELGGFPLTHSAGQPVHPQASERTLHDVHLLLQQGDGHTR